MSRGTQRAIRGAFVALVASCACGRPLPAYPGGGDAGRDERGEASGDVADTSPDLRQRLDLAIEVDCPECNGSCGDGVLHGSEQCDDGNRTAGDGCSAICQIPSGWICPVPGMPCQRTADQDAALD
jgi:cysteine-rich repeat protein